MRVLMAGLAMAAACLSSPALAADRETEIRGGPGGVYFYMRCAPGEYLVGVEGKRGAWIDLITPLCARWNSTERRFNPATRGLSFGEGRSFYRYKAACQRSYFILALEIAATHDDDDNPQFVQRAVVKCERLERPFLREDIATGPDRPFAGGHDTALPTGSVPRIRFLVQCPPRQVAVGLIGREGAYVDALGLICGERPDYYLDRRIQGESRRDESLAPAERRGDTQIQDARPPPGGAIPKR